jgi:hypothetical protein
MQSRNWKDTEPVLNANGIHGVKIYSQPEGEIVHLALAPGAHLKATISIGEEKQSFPKDTTIDSPKAIPHAVTNEGEGNLRLLVIKMPKP